MEYQVKNISANDFEQCIKCTICTVYCPVAAVNTAYPGPKQAGPDGERYRLKNPEFYNNALKYCLNCKRCEVSCPNNVRIGDIIQTARIRYDKSSPKLRDRMLASTDFMGSVATKMAPVVNLMLGLAPVKATMHGVLGIDRHRTFPKYTSRTFEKWMRTKAPDQNVFPNKVAYFHGCYVNYNFPQLGEDVVTMLNAVGYGVELLEKERCCGVAKISNRLIDSARTDAQINIDSIRKAVKAGMEVVGASSTCIFTMRDEYPHLLGIDNADVRDDISLVSVFLYKLIDSGKVKLAFKPGFRCRVTYHTPCHMQKLGWGIYSSSLIKLIPGVEFEPIDSLCCGIAGTYGFKKENYPYSQAIGKELFDQIERARVDYVVTDCETCKWQIEMSTGATVLNPVSLLAMALDVEATRKLNNVK